MTTPLFLLRCVQLGISIADLDLLTIGLVSRAQLGEKEGGPEAIFPASYLARLPKPDHC